MIVKFSVSQCICINEPVVASQRRLVSAEETAEDQSEPAAQTSLRRVGAAGGKTRTTSSTCSCLNEDSLSYTSERLISVTQLFLCNRTTTRGRKASARRTPSHDAGRR